MILSLSDADSDLARFNPIIPQFVKYLLDCESPPYPRPSTGVGDIDREQPPPLRSRCRTLISTPLPSIPHFSLLSFHLSPRQHHLD
ncbi:hypothetical protein OPV22_015597 [Ensete ventricosum]|uniref:Uncharacterized protein n=1 Tax=Ensete ventricosum TaxID=4639 RepID=A0AAV8REK8_ENSVE|nr:hypothetical protein OPV22_015597 [Ensete ventricosum]